MLYSIPPLVHSEGDAIAPLSDADRRRLRQAAAAIVGPDRARIGPAAFSPQVANVTEFLARGPLVGLIGPLPMRVT